MVLLEEINNSNCEEVKNIKIPPDQEKYLPKEFVCLSRGNMIQHSYESYLVYKDSKPVGFVLLQVDKKGEYFNILFIVIDQDYQEQSYYKESLAVSINYLISQGASQVGAYYPKGNEKLQQIYLSVGFTPTNVEKDGKVYLTYAN